MVGMEVVARGSDGGPNASPTIASSLAETTFPGVNTLPAGTRCPAQDRYARRVLAGRCLTNDITARSLQGHALLWSHDSVRTWGSRAKKRLLAALTNSLSNPVTPSSRATPAFFRRRSASVVQPIALRCPN